VDTTLTPDPAAGLESASDEALMALVAAGSIAAPVAVLYRRHNAELFNFLVWLLRGDRRLAEEICQETWERVMTRPEGFREPGNFRAWACCIGRNLWLDRCRRRAREAPLEDAEAALGAADFPSADELAAREDDVARLATALMALPGDQREAIVLRYHAELPLAGIAAAVECPVETVKSRLRYAYARLREALGVGP